MPTTTEKRAIKRIFDAAQKVARTMFPNLSISYILYLLDKPKTGKDSPKEVEHG